MSDPPHGGLTTDIPEQLGNYRILGVLGEGAMGVVYEAEEIGLVKRHVAIKVIRAGVSDREVLARFEAERQTLALMDHPGIARVLDAGSTASGQPFFAMELARGLPITEYCDSRRLSVAQRLELFIAVCHAVQHAHQKGVIHRDMKPSNVLVTEQDDRPQPKIIDFGIAKALGPQLGEAALRTRWGQALGTPAYMSPEQAESGGIDVDTRADIYSLGVLLYEILTSRLPMDPSEIGMQAFLLHLKLRDTTPPAPSTRMRTLGHDGAAIAAARRANPATLRSELHGDIDWIVMKAMEQDRLRRYATANALAMDLQRYLLHQPIVARPPSTAYRIRMFTRRHRAGVAAVAIAIIALGLGTTFSLIAWRRAEREAAFAQAVTTFFVDLFDRSDPDKQLGTVPTTRELLDRSVQRIRIDLAGEPPLQGRLMFTMGDVYTRLGLYPSADSLLQDAVRIREQTFGPNDTAVASALAALGTEERLRGDSRSADRDLRRALAIEQLHFGASSPLIALTLTELGALASAQERPAEAESLYLRALAIDQQPPASDQKALARDLMGLGVVHYRLGHLEQAEPYFRRALNTQIAALGPDHAHVAATENNLGALYYMMGRYNDALPLYQAAFVFYERTLSTDHPYIGFVLANLGEANWKLGRFAEAERLFRRSIRIEEAKLLPYNGEIAVPLNGLAGVLRDTHRYSEAERLYQRALDIRIRAYGLKSPVVDETRRDYEELQRRRARGVTASR